jgi:hypothetical protein
MTLELRHPNPAFPPELEREIFETTALMYLGQMPTLLRVARRVLIWFVFREKSFTGAHSEV